MMREVILLVVTVSFAISVPVGAFAQEPMGDCLPDDEGMDGLDAGFLIGGLVLTGANLILIANNASNLQADEPSGGMGMGGILAGTLGTIYGTAILFSDEPTVMYAGLGCAVVGAVSFYFGIRSTMASNRKYDENQGQGMVIDPILIGDGSGRLGPGLQVSWKF